MKKEASKPAKNPAAISLGKARWKGVSTEDRAQQMGELAKKAAASMTPEQRSARAKKAAAASAVVRAKKPKKKSSK